jgi:hypothetical protein
VLPLLADVLGPSHYMAAGPEIPCRAPAVVPEASLVCLDYSIPLSRTVCPVSVALDLLLLLLDCVDCVVSDDVAGCDIVALDLLLLLLDCVVSDDVAGGDIVALNLLLLLLDCVVSDDVAGLPCVSCLGTGLGGRARRRETSSLPRISGSSGVIVWWRGEATKDSQTFSSSFFLCTLKPGIANGFRGRERLLRSLSSSRLCE